MMDFPRIDFDYEKIKLTNLYDCDELQETECQNTPDLIKKVYGDLCFPEAKEDRPYTFCSLVKSMDGKIGFVDKPVGPLVSQKNRLDPDGGLADFWILNMLRAYSDLIVCGAGTLKAEDDYTSHIFDEELEKIRLNEFKKELQVPITLVVSLDGTDIPFEHDFFKLPSEVKKWVNTSPAGVKYLKENVDFPFLFIRPTRDEKWEELYNKVINFDGVVVFETGEGTTTDAKLLFYVLRKLKIETVLVESPSYLWYLMQQKMLDEAFINYSGLYTGGTITTGLNQPFSTEDHPHVKFLKISLHKSNFIYTRQKLIYDK